MIYAPGLKKAGSQGDNDLIHKISNLIALLAHQRDLLLRLAELKKGSFNGKVAESLEWKSQIQYLFDTESRIVQAKVNYEEQYTVS